MASSLCCQPQDAHHPLLLSLAPAHSFVNSPFIKLFPIMQVEGTISVLWGTPTNNRLKKVEKEGLKIETRAGNGVFLKMVHFPLGCEG